MSITIESKVFMNLEKLLINNISIISDRIISFP